MPDNTTPQTPQSDEPLPGAKSPAGAGASQDDATQSAQTSDTGQSDNGNATSPLSAPETTLLAMQKELDEMTEMAKRAVADLQNFKRRTDEEKSGLIVFANLTFLQAIFPVIDNFQRAFQHIPQELTEKEWIKGIFAIEKQFMDTLKTLGFEEIGCEPGTPFDANFHEVVMQAPGEKDMILECFEKGYQFKDKVIRPAKIKVGDGSVNPSNSTFPTQNTAPPTNA
ncbi:MAG: Protein GrpE [Candidatus Peregrinibacteria bacterium GW2011_GWA2_44_7]|nr:MAG: Protein GrpE [Candidatus Peregrinibacteria bacterium GW2011_GWA2_44_7]